MNILIADPDRDFLKAFQTLLDLSGHTVTTVFDGTQVITGLHTHRYDMVVLNENIPRIAAKELIAEIQNRGIPVIVLSAKHIHSELLSTEPLANAYLSLPFLPYELVETIDRVQQQRQSGERLAFDEAVIEASAFLLCRSLPVTEGETAVFRALVQHEPINNKRAGPYITALNYKLEKLKKNVRIRYLMNDGYRLVKMNYE